MIVDQKDKHSQEDKLSTFVEELAICYNNVCELLKFHVSKVRPNSILLKKNADELDPTEVTDPSKLLTLPDLDYLKDMIKKNSNYSVEPKASHLQYLFT